MASALALRTSSSAKRRTIFQEFWSKHGNEKDIPVQHSYAPSLLNSTPPLANASQPCNNEDLAIKKTYSTTKDSSNVHKNTNRVSAGFVDLKMIKDMERDHLLLRREMFGNSFRRNSIGTTNASVSSPMLHSCPKMQQKSWSSTSALLRYKHRRQSIHSVTFNPQVNVFEFDKLVMESETSDEWLKHFSYGCR